ncbi:MAG: hypothetical protein GOMPHAMPRED_006392 [Gomphillus americanus]|uniref:Uncharacterized protein n=1 Tax=Gomphillus americanus TaxID=1940652 RepID=A0A8H3FYY3_9LECA|nr:MAG: hypothetical protein GOMPHAMPRED_006392 [Gomphillus americanus]
MSWFWRGAQSAVFYYLSCTPWFVYVNERKREKERSRAKAGKSSEDAEEGTYTHPLASDTNPYWNEEMMMGPGLKRGRNSKEKTKESTKRLNTGGEESSAGENSLSLFPSLEGVEEIKMDESWNKKKYQRPDEYLWGSDDPSCASYVSLNSRAANKPLVSGDGAYYNAQNPAVRELHPPIISNRPKHPSQALWMTQPPPPAKIMEGKERADRSRSVSNASFASGQGTGGALAGRHASSRKYTGQLELPENMDPSPPEDDGTVIDDDKLQEVKRGKRILLHPNDIPLSKENDGRPQTSVSLHIPSTREAHFNAGTKSEKVIDKSMSPISPLQPFQDLVPGRSTNKAQAIPISMPLQNKKSAPSTEPEHELLAYSFPVSKRTEEHYMPTQRWSMDI